MDVFCIFFLLFLNITLYSFSKGDNGCRDLDFLRCHANKTLKDHVIRSLRVSSPAKPNCQHACFVEEQCISYNLGKPLDGLSRSTCELNDADHLSDPGDLEPSAGTHYCPIKNPCASKSCPAKKVCEPDFAWNTYHCKDGKWSKWSAWSECRCFNRARSRECKNPLTKQTATDCIGPKTQNEKCQHKIECVLPLGMQDKTIPDGQITATSIFNIFGAVVDGCRPAKGRLNQCCGQAWCAGKNSPGEYLQVDLGSVKKIDKIATQGQDAFIKNYVTKYELHYSNDTNAWQKYPVQINGNGDATSVVTYRLSSPVQARYVRVVVVHAYPWPAMRVELYTVL